MSSELQTGSTFLLPGGLVLEDRRLGTVELRPLTGREEEWLAGHADTPAARAVTKLLDACVTHIEDLAPTTELIRRLLVGDRDYLVLQLRRLTFGDEFRAVLACPECGSKMDVDFSAAEVPMERRPQRSSSHIMELAGEAGGSRVVRFRLPTGGDQEAVLHMDSAGAAATLLERCVLDDGGSPLTTNEKGAVIDAMEGIAPQLDIQLDLTCPECSHAFVSEFDTTAFFLQEMQRNCRLLLHEIHALALHYHWSEADILNFRRERRRAYLGLLSDTLRQET